MDWSKIKHFTPEEFACQGPTHPDGDCGCGGRADMDQEFVEMIDQLRELDGQPMSINSGFRCPVHNNRVSSTGFDGPHTTGKSADIRASGERADRLLGLSYTLGFTGRGLHQKGDHKYRYLHLDKLPPPGRPWVWTY